jgi:hypothetical protein
MLVGCLIILLTAVALLATLRVRHPLLAWLQLTAEVDQLLRRRIRAHHTATHLLQSALKQVLGPDTCQQGSLVEAGRLRWGTQKASLGCLLNTRTFTACAPACSCVCCACICLRNVDICCLWLRRWLDGCGLHFVRSGSGQVQDPRAGAIILAQTHCAAAAPAAAAAAAAGLTST